MTIPKIIERLLTGLNEKDIDDTIFMYYKNYGSNPRLLNEMIKTYISVILNEKLNNWNPIPGLPLYLS